MKIKTLARCLPLSALLLCFIANADDEVEKPSIKPRRTEISGVPWNPATLPPNKVTYGTDDRRDVFEETDEARRAWADSTCALVDKNDVLRNSDGTYNLRVSGYEIFGLPPCEGEPYGNQPTVAFCTGFVVGPDLIATAGHCISDSDLSITRFVFGFRMENATTPRTTFDETAVYTGVEVIADKVEGAFDYAIIRVDREIVAPGARILPLRTAGSIPEGTKVGVIGHPTGLPTKLAFGENTVVRDNASPGFFVANLDAYGGNSGSPVFNADTGVVEGILVRGENDFEFQENCFVSRQLSNSGGLGEDVSKSTTFANFIQIGRGSVTLDKSAYRCADTMGITLFDVDLEGSGTAELSIFTSGLDSESLVLEESGRYGTFTGTIPVSAGEAVAGNGVLEASEGATIFVTYRDMDTGGGAVGDAVATARVDCTPPEISEIRVERVGGNRATIAFTTNEPAAGMISAGTDCMAPSHTGLGDFTIFHQVEIQNLSQVTPYLFTVSATDGAGNSTTIDNGGACFTVTTTDQVDYLTEAFFDGISDIENTTVTFTPDNSTSGYRACVSSASVFPTSPNCGEPLFLGDDDFVEYSLVEGREVTLFGKEYGTFFVGSNGYVTFGEGDTSYDPTLEAHFSLPRISAYFSDLFPADGGTINVSEMRDRVAITYYNIYDYFGDLQSFQIEMFYDGTIRLTWLVNTFPYGIVGLSRGSGMRRGIDESDLSGYSTCIDSPYEDVICSSMVPNDACDGAIAANLDQAYRGSTSFALGSNDIAGCESCFGQDVWYTFTPTASGLHTISLCGSGFDTVLGLYAGSCDDLVLVAGNDDSFCGFQSVIITELTEGTIYRIRVSGYNVSTGGYELVVSEGGKGGFGCGGPGQSGNPLTDILLMAGMFLGLVIYARRTHGRFQGSI